MASVGHVMVGMAAGRGYLPRGASKRRLAISMVCFSLLSLAPDLDVIGFKFGVAYQAPWGHRGASHSLCLALVAGLVMWAVARRARLALFVTSVIASHGLLDTLTNGGLGCALFWPMSTERFFAPVRPLPVAPIGLGMLTSRGLSVVAIELIVFLPALLFALVPRRQRLDDPHGLR